MEQISKCDPSSAIVLTRYINWQWFLQNIYINLVRSSLDNICEQFLFVALPKSPAVCFGGICIVTFFFETVD